MKRIIVCDVWRNNWCTCEKDLCVCVCVVWWIVDAIVKRMCVCLCVCDVCGRICGIV